MENVSYYSDKFLTLASHNLITELPLENADGLKPDLNLDDVIEAKFFRLGSQEFIELQPPVDKTSRLIVGDIKNENGHPIGFSVGMAMLCLYASNLGKSTRVHLTDMIHNYLIDENGSPKIKEMSADNYLTIMKLQNALKLPAGTLTKYIGNIQELDAQLGQPDNIIREYKKNHGLIYTQPDDDGTLKVSKTLREIIDPRQYDLFDENKNANIQALEALNSTPEEIIEKSDLGNQNNNEVTNDEAEETALLNAIISNFQPSEPSVPEQSLPQEESVAVVEAEIEVQALEESEAAVEAAVEAQTQTLTEQTVVVDNQESEVEAVVEVEAEPEIDINAISNEIQATVEKMENEGKFQSDESTIQNDVPEVNEVGKPTEEVANQEPEQIVPDKLIENHSHESYIEEIEQFIENNPDYPNIPHDETMEDEYVKIEDGIPNNEIAVQNSELSVEEQVVATNEIEEPNEKLSSLINLVNASVDNVVNNPNEETVKDLAVAMNQLLLTDNTLDVSNTFETLSSNVSDENVKMRLQGLATALNYKHNDSTAMIKYDEFMEKPYLSYYNLIIDNNLQTLKSIRAIQSQEKIESFAQQYNDNGALKEYIAGKYIENDFDNSFSAKATNKGLTSLSSLATFATQVNDPEVAVAIIDNLHNAKLNDKYIVDEAERLMAAMTSTREMNIGGNTVPAHEFFKEEFLARFEDIGVQQLRLNKSTPVFAIALRGACNASHTKEGKQLVGDVLRGLQGLADNGIVSQEYVKDSYQGVASILSGSALAHVMTNEEIEKYDVSMSKLQKQERQRILKQEEAENKKQNKHKLK